MCQPTTSLARGKAEETRVAVLIVTFLCHTSLPIPCSPIGRMTFLLALCSEAPFWPNSWALGFEHQLAAWPWPCGFHGAATWPWPHSHSARACHLVGQWGARASDPSTHCSFFLGKDGGKFWEAQETSRVFVSGVYEP